LLYTVEMNEQLQNLISAVESRFPDSPCGPMYVLPGKDAIALLSEFGFGHQDLVDLLNGYWTSSYDPPYIIEVELSPQSIKVEAMQCVRFLRWISHSITM